MSTRLTPDDLPEPVRELLDVFLGAIDEQFPDRLLGLHVVGSVALDAWIPGRSDVDVVAVVRGRPTVEERPDWQALHDRVHATAQARGLPALDGCHVRARDLQVDPLESDPALRFTGAELVDDDAFDPNPVTWHVLATHGVTVRGKAAQELTITTSRASMTEFCRENLDGYWRPLADRIAAAGPDLAFDDEGVVWCLTGPLRLVHTIATGQVVSKLGALDTLDDVRVRSHAPIIDEARAILHGAPTTLSGTDRTAAVHAMLADVLGD